MKSLFLKLFLATLCLSLPLGARAETTVGAGVSVSTSPYRHAGLSWNPVPLLAYEGENFYLRGVKAGYKLYHNENLEFSLFARYDQLHFDASDNNNHAMKQLKDRDSSVSVGAAARIVTPIAMFYADVAVDALNNSKGVTASLGLMKSWDFGSMQLIPTVGVRAYNRMYNNYYFGVSDGESRRSGIRTYRAASGLEPYAGLTMNYKFTESVGGLLGAQISYLPATVRNSPMVNADTSVNLTCGVTYSF